MRAVILGMALLALAGHAMAQASPTPAAPAVPTERELREACSWDPAGLRECLQKKLRESEVALAQAEALRRSCASSQSGAARSRLFRMAALRSAII